MLAVLCVIPQTTAIYEVLPLTLLVRTRRRPPCTRRSRCWRTCSTCSARRVRGPSGAEYQWWVMLALFYAPALALVLRRPNVGPIVPEKPPDFGGE